MGFWTELSTGVTTNDKQTILDQRVAACLLCIQIWCSSEYNIGKGPRIIKSQIQ
jgi:hypothetical protein